MKHSISRAWIICIGFLPVCLASCIKQQEKAPVVTQEPPLGKDTIRTKVEYFQFGGFGNVAYLDVRDKANDSLYSIEMWYDVQEWSRTNLDTADIIGPATTFDYPTPEWDKDSTNIVIHNANTVNLTTDIYPDADVKNTLGVKRISFEITPQTDILFDCTIKARRAEYMLTDAISRAHAKFFIEYRLYHDLAIQIISKSKIPLRKSISKERNSSHSRKAI